MREGLTSSNDSEQVQTKRTTANSATTFHNFATGSYKLLKALRYKTVGSSCRAIGCHIDSNNKVQFKWSERLQCHVNKPWLQHIHTAGWWPDRPKRLSARFIKWRLINWETSDVGNILNKNVNGKLASSVLFLNTQDYAKTLICYRKYKIINE